MKVMNKTPSAMKEIILGREGNQSFKISQPGVSKEHARLTIDGDVWMLEDLNSSNGTFILDDKGEMTQVAKLQIQPQTLICLGADNANGCSFYARYAADGNYPALFDYLEERDTSFRKEEEKAEEMPQTVRKVVGTISALALVLSFCVTGNLAMMLLRVGTLASAASSFLYNPAKKKKELKAIRGSIFRCPNPACSHVLSAKEIHNRRCSKCKTQG
jgi:hypothetical protein